MSHFSLSYLGSLICCHPSRFETSEYFCSNLLNKYINHRDNDNFETLRPQTRSNIDFVDNYASTRPVNAAAPYYYGDIAFHHNYYQRQPQQYQTISDHFKPLEPLISSTSYWNNYNHNNNSHSSHHHHYYQQQRSKYSTIMDGLRVQFKNQVRHSNQYLRSPNVHRSDEFKVSLRGWLYRLEGAALKQWKRRWCVLADYCLFYYKDMAEEKMLGSLLLPSYKISPCFSRDGISRKFSFKAEHNNMKTYYFSADSKEIQQQWMNALSMASIMQLSAIFSSNEMDINNKINGNNENLIENKNINNNNNVDNDNNNNDNNNNKESLDMIMGTSSGTIDDESGFVAYHQAKRMQETSGSNTISSIYPNDHYNNVNLISSYNMFNSIGLPVFYSDSVNNHLEEYINAPPPKPQRHYYDLMLPYDLSSSSLTDYKINQDLNHNYFFSGDQNFVPYLEYLQVNQFHYNNNAQQQNANAFNQQHRLPPRPHSADFLERNQDYELDEECQTLFMHNANDNNNNKSDQYRSDMNSEHRILPTRPKSSIEKYDFPKGSYGMKADVYGDSKLDQLNTYMNKSMYGYDTEFFPVMDNELNFTKNFNNNKDIIEKFNESSNLNNVNHSMLNETIPNRPPLPQEYVFRFQKNTPPQNEITSCNEQQSPLITKPNSRENEFTTYTSDDEILRQMKKEPDKIDPFELSKEEYYRASKMFYQRQQCSQAVSLNSGLSGSESQQNNKTNYLLENDWNDIGLPIPNPTINHNHSYNSLLKKMVRNGASYSTNEIGTDEQNLQFNEEELEVKFKLGLNVRTYRKPKSYNVPNEHSPLNYNEEKMDLSNIRQQQQDYMITDNVMKDVEIMYGKKKIENDACKVQSSAAPYYYSDLLSEEQKIALQKKLGDFASPPPLLSRCTATNNTRFLGTTSLTLNNNKNNNNNDNNNNNNSNNNHHNKYIKLKKNISKHDQQNNSYEKKIDDEQNSLSFNKNLSSNHQKVIDDSVNNKTDDIQSKKEQHIYENCSNETKSLSSNHKDSKVVDRKLRKYENNKISKSKMSFINNDNIDSLHEMPVEHGKKKRRKKKSKENINNASDSEIQFNLERVSRKTFFKSSKRFSASAAEYIGKSQEELILMLIQLRRKQSQLLKASEKLRLQMDSEEKMMEIEPYRKDDYKFRFNELNKKWNEVNREYELQIPIIQTIDHMIKIKSKSKLNELNKKKAASTSVLDKVCDENQFEEHNNNSQSGDIDSDSNTNAETSNENIEILKRQQRVLESELDRVRGMLTHSTKKLEEKAVENAQMEQEMLLARNKLKQVLENEQEAMQITRSSKLEAELAHINKVIDDLHNRRKELNNAIENLKNSEANFTKSLEQPPLLNDENNQSNFHFSQEDLRISKAETNLYPLYENIKKSKDLFENQNNEKSHNKDENINEGTNNNNKLNDEFFTLNINLDKHPKLLKRIKGNGINKFNDFSSNVNTMCEFDPNKDIALGYGDSIVDQQIKQIYNYQPGILASKYNEVKTVREVKRESERRKYNQQQQIINRTNIYNRNNYESYIPLSNHYFNETNEISYLNNSENDLKTTNQMKYDVDENNEQSPRSFNAPDIVQSTIKLTDKI